MTRLLKRKVPYLSVQRNGYNASESEQNESCRHGNGSGKEKKKRTYTNSPKPVTCNMEYGQTRTSQPSPRLMIQIVMVLQVSVMLRAVAETWRVTLRPKKLKKPMENAMATDEPRTRGLDMVWCHPRGRSKKGERSAIDGKMKGSGVRRRMESVPKKPSQPTATSGATEYVDMIFSSMTNCVAVLQLQDGCQRQRKNAENRTE